MEVKTFMPDLSIAQFVRLYLSIQGHFPTSLPHHITPKGEAAIVFPFNQPIFSEKFILSNHVKTDMIKGIDQPIFIGQCNKFCLLNWGEHIDLIVVPLKTAGLYNFLQGNAVKMVNSVYSLQYLNLASTCKDLQELLWKTNDPETAQILVNQWLVSHFLVSKQCPFLSGLTPVTDWIDQHLGMVNIGAIAKKFKVSTRRLEQQFEEQLGLRPKEYCRIIRFRSIVRNIYKNKSDSWMDLVTEFNLHDQSHLIREFRQFAGVTPTSFFQECSLFDQLVYEYAFK